MRSRSVGRAVGGRRMAKSPFWSEIKMSNLSVGKFSKFALIMGLPLIPAGFVACKKGSADYGSPKKSSERAADEKTNLAKAPAQMIARLTQVGETVKIDFVSVDQAASASLSGSNLEEIFNKGQNLKLAQNSGTWIASANQKAAEGAGLTSVNLYDSYPIYPTDPNYFPPANPGTAQQNQQQPTYLPQQQTYLPQSQNYQQQPQGYFPQQAGYNGQAIQQTQQNQQFQTQQTQQYQQIGQQYGAGSGFGYGYNQGSGADFGFGFPFLSRITQRVKSILGAFSFSSILQSVLSIFKISKPYYYYGSQAVPYNYSGQNYQSGNSSYYQFQNQGQQNGQYINCCQSANPQ